MVGISILVVPADSVFSVEGCPKGGAANFLTAQLPICQVYFNII